MDAALLFFQIAEKDYFTSPLTAQDHPMGNCNQPLLQVVMPPQRDFVSSAFAVFGQVQVGGCMATAFLDQLNTFLTTKVPD